MAAIMENTLFLFTVNFIMVQPHNERSTKGGTRIQEPEQLAYFITKMQHTLKRDFIRVYKWLPDGSQGL